MNIFLLIISLLLNGLAIYAIIVLYTRQNRLIEVEKNQGKMIAEMEELISSYLFEMKEENEAFLKKFELLSSDTAKKEASELNIRNRTIKPLHKTGQSKQKKGSKTEKFTETDARPLEVGRQQAAKIYQSNQKLGEIDIIESREEVDSLLAELDYSKEMDEQVTEKTETIKKKNEANNFELDSNALASQVVLMAKQGMSEEEIAKNLKRGKTEIELLLKFQQNNKE